MAIDKVWVLAEEAEGGGGPTPVTLELLTEARSVASTVEAVAWGAGAASLAGPLGEYGATTLYDVGDLGGALPGVPVAAALAALIEGGNAPDVILFPATYDGRDIAGRLSAKLDKPVLTNVTGLVEGDGGLSSQHPVFGGSLIVTARFTGGGPGLFVIRAKSFAAEPAGGGAAAVTAAPVPDVATNTAKVVERHVEERSGPKLDEAAVVVSGGRGLGEAANYAMIEELAKLLHGAAGAVAGHRRRRLGAVFASGGPDGQDGEAHRLHGVRDFRRHPAPGGHEGVEEHHRHQQGPGGADLLGGRPGDCGRRAQGPAGADRGAQGQRLSPAPPRRRYRPSI